MATNFDYITEYSSLGVNLNRQKRGPLDGSSVFKSTKDFICYIIGTRNSISDLSTNSVCSAFVDASDYVLTMRRYGYVGQIVSVVEDGEVKIYKITDIPASVEEAAEGIESNSLFEQVGGSDVYFKNYTLDGVPLSGYNNLSVLKVTEDEYNTLIYTGEINSLSNVLFIVSSDVYNFHNLKLRNVEDGVDPSDAATVGQLRQQVNTLSTNEVVLTTAVENPVSVITNISQTNGIIHLTAGVLTQSMVQNLSTDLSNLSSAIASHDSGIHVDATSLSAEGQPISVITHLGEKNNKLALSVVPLKEEMIEGLASDLNNLSNMISTKVFVENQQISDYVDTLSILQISRDEYYDMSPNSYLSNTIYIVSSDTINAYDERIENLADGINDHDAVNKKQVQSIIDSKNAQLKEELLNDKTDVISSYLSGYPSLDSVQWDQISIERVIDMVKFVYSKMSGGKVNY